MSRLDQSEWRAVDGVLLLDKPENVSSNAALQLARRLYRAKKAGHGGTLDPLATGLLPVLLGEATKFGAAALDADKTYQARLALGVTTRTGDAEGEILERRPVALTDDQIARVVARFCGNVLQLPPMYSALKRNGRPLYAYARAGVSIERAPRAVTIHELHVDAYQGAYLDLTIRCSKGTYIRVLAADIGRELGCGAHLAALRRTGIGGFTLEQAFSVPVLAALSEGERDALLRPVDALLESLVPVVLDTVAAGRFVQGQTIEAVAAGLNRVRVYRADGGAFLGLGEIGIAGQLRPLRLIDQHAANRA
jgi:tRNA pseudouridine55 synthase